MIDVYLHSISVQTVELAHVGAGLAIDRSAKLCRGKLHMHGRERFGSDQLLDIPQVEICIRAIGQREYIRIHSCHMTLTCACIFRCLLKITPRQLSGGSRIVKKGGPLTGENKNGVGKAYEASRKALLGESVKGD